MYSLIHKIGLWSDLNNKDRMIRILIAGSVFYIIIYAILVSQYAANIPILQQNVHYLYYIMGSDLLYLGSQNIFSQTSILQSIGIKKQRRKKSNKNGERQHKQLKNKSQCHTSSDSHTGKTNDFTSADSDDTSIPVYINKKAKNIEIL